jgi:Na+/H+ antiporter NhaD/arsenite permease-like protein
MAIALVTFIGAYVLLIDGYYHRTAVVVFASAFLIVVGVLPLSSAFAAINWNVIGIFFGMLILTDLFLESRMPEVLAASVARRSTTVGGAVLGMAILASILSAFLDNVAVVLIFAPIAIALAHQLKAPATPFLIGIALSSNLQAAALLVGDPPAMILGTYAGLSFNDFFWYQGAPGIFFAVQIGAAVSMVILWLMLRRFRSAVTPLSVEPPRSLVPTVLMAGMLLSLVAVSTMAGSGGYATSITVLLFALVGWVWHITHHATLPSRDGELSIGAKESLKPLSALARRYLPLRERLWKGHRLLRELDWETTFFLVGVFVLVGALVHTGVVTHFTEWFGSTVGTNPLHVYISLVVFSVAVSAFVDNVPFTLAMLPVCEGLASAIGIPPFLFYAGMLIGASIGGNITPIGASANVVAYRWIEQRTDEKISFLGFVRYGLPFTLASVLAASVFGWFMWS